MANLSFILLLTLVAIVKLYAFPSGAPLDRCGSMLPGHNADPITDTAPYHILVEPLSSKNSSFNGRSKD